MRASSMSAPARSVLATPAVRFIAYLCLCAAYVATDLLLDGEAHTRAEVIDRFRKFLLPILAFAVGAVGGALIYAQAGLFALAGPAIALMLASARGTGVRGAPPRSQT